MGEERGPPSQQVSIMTLTTPGQIVVLNGAPRAGKSSIARAIQATFDGVWMNLGVDNCMAATPEALQPGLGLRPGGERPDLEPLVALSYAALYDSIAAHSRLGLNVVADVGHHDAYSRPLGILPDCARRLADSPVLFVGVRCSIEAIMERRNRGEAGREGRYAAGSESDPVPAPVRAWQEAVHRPGVYDLEVDTTEMSAEDCTAVIRAWLAEPVRSPTAFERLAGWSERS
jgi:chloramphenicol 3-O phosphotransferase